MPLAVHVLSLLLFGANGIVAGYIGLSSYEIVWFRTVLGSALLMALFFLGRGKLTFFRKKKDFGSLCISGAAMGASWMLLYEAFARVGVSVATLLYDCGPVIVLALSPLFFGERLTPVRLVGFGAVVLGVLLVNGFTGGAADSGGILCGLLSAAGYAVMVIANKKARGITGMENAMLQLAVACLTVTVFLALGKSFPGRVETEWVLPILALGLVHTGVGCWMYFTTIGRLPAQTVAVCGYLEPLAAVILSWAILGERLSPMQMLGAALILGGAAAAEMLGRGKTSRI